MPYSTVVGSISYVSNGVFRSVGRGRVSSRSKKFLETGFVPVSAPQKGKSRTIFGPWFRHHGIVYGVDLSTRLQSLYRLFNSRGGDKNRDTGLRENQLSCNFTTYDRFIDLKRRVEIALQPRTDRHAEVCENAAEVHPKRFLRLSALKTLTENGLVYGYEYTKKVVAKLKTFEWAKPGKAPRNIVDLSCPGSLLGGWLLSIMKHCMEEPFISPTMWSAYIPNPNIQRVDAAFRRIIDPIHSTFIYFSDDACASFRCSDGVLMVNLDISGCDGSHTTRIFDLFEFLLSDTVHSQTGKWLVSQCMLPLHFVEGACRMLFQPTTPVLFSGSVLTTFINNLGISTIANSLDNCYTPTMTKNQMLKLIPLACASVGYLVTVQVCDVPEDLQFLKLSPCRLEKGGYTSCLNLGVILRTLGQCAGDLPGKSSVSLLTRSYTFNQSIIAGFVHAGDNGLLRVLREKYPASSTRIFSSYLTGKLSGAVHTASDLSVCLRYRLTVSEWQELLSLLNASELGDILWCPAFDKIMRVDYGMTT